MEEALDIHRSGRWRRAPWRWRRHGWLLLLGLLAPWASANVMPASYTVSSWTMDDGLPHDVVHALAQGPDGLIWIGTWEGVARFNGNVFTVFDRQNTPGLEMTGVQAILRDRQGGMLFGTAFDGVYRYRSGVWEQLGDASARRLQVTALAQRAGGSIWVGTPQSLYRIEQDGRLVEVGVRAGLPVARVTGLLPRGDGALLIGSERGLFVLKSPQAKVTRWSGSSRLAHAAVRRVVEDGDGGILVASDDGVWWLHADGNVAHLHPSERIDAVLRDRQGRLWMAPASGPVVLDPPNHGAELTLAVDGAAATLMEDEIGSIWVGNARGLHRVARGAAYALDGLRSDYVRSVLQTVDGDWWVGDAAGLERIHRGKTAPVPIAASGGDTAVLALTRARDGGVWVGTYNQGVVRVGRDGRVIRRIGADDGLPSPYIRSLLEDSDGGLWIGTTAGLAYFRRGHVRRYWDGDGVPERPIQVLYRDHAGTLWVGADQGMAAILPGGRIRRWQSELDMPAQNIFDFLEDKDGSLWIASDRGLLRWQGDVFHVYDHRLGLPRDKVFRVLGDADDHLWLSSTQGVFRVERGEFDQVDAGTRHQLSVEVIDHADGMPGDQCNGASWPAGWMTDDGLLLIPTSAGLGVIEPDHVAARQHHRVPVVLERVAIDGVSRPLQDGYRLGPDSQRVVIGYAGLSFQAPNKVRYRYRMRGFDPEWVEAETSTEAVYTNLPAGEFVFEVEAMSLPVDWRKRELVGAADVAFQVIPAWWRRDGVIAGAAIGLVMLVVCAYLWRVASFRRRQRWLNNVIDVRTRELSAKNQALLTADREREELLRQLEYLAAHDDLTGLPNRREAERFLHRALEAARNDGSSLAIAIGDIDHFKHINDTYGHEVGDEVLRRVGELLGSLHEARARFFAARHGGEEFLLVACGVPEAEARAMFEHIRRQIGELRVRVGSIDVRCTASMGIAVFDAAHASPQQLLLLADQRLYQAKDLGRDQLVAG